MPRRSLIAVLVVLGALLAMPASALASADVTDADVSLRLAPDASLLVNERLTVRLRGHLSRVLPRHPAVRGRGDRREQHQHPRGEPRLPAGRLHDLRLHGPDGQVRRHAGAGRGAIRIVWHHNASNEQRTFILSYRVAAREHVRAHDDVIDVYWKVWGDQWDFSLDHLTADLKNPALDPANPLYRVWGHPRDVEGKTVRGQGEATLEASDIPAHQFVELRVTIPRAKGQDVSAAGEHSGNGLPAILAEEQGLTDDFNSPWNKTKRFVAHHAELLAGLVTALLLLILALMLWLAREHPTSTGKYVPEPPDDASPALAYGLATRGRGLEQHGARHAARPGRARLLRHEERDHRGREARPRHLEGRASGRAEARDLRAGDARRSSTS